MTVEFLEEAEHELFDAALWYESKQPGLGGRFRMEVEAVSRSLALNPLLQRERDGGYRRINCPVFPYYLPYFIRHDKIIVLAVSHEHRQPGYWSQRELGG
jgi:toxin ParE1/3/4